MEKHGIGTDASIPTHINNIIERQYVTVVDPGRQLVPTPLGLALVKGYCSIDPELVLPSIRQNIEKSCELIAKGKAEFGKVLAHVLKMFKLKFDFFRQKVSTMERLLEVMLKTQSGRLGKEFYMVYKIPLKADSEKTKINFCMKCFKGHICLNYNNKKGWGLKCDSCNFRVSILEGAARVLIEEGDEGRCGECDSRILSATYKPSDTKTPFPGNARAHTGCILCDTIMRSTVVNFFVNRKKKDLTEEELKAMEDVRKKKEEKKKKATTEGATVTAQKTGGE